MEDNRKGPYSILTKNDVKEKMKKQIDEMSEIFLISKADTTVLLMFLRWDSLRVSERFSENKDKLLSESGLFDMSRDVCDVFHDHDDDYVFVIDGDGDDEVYDDAIGSNRAIPNSSCAICLDNNGLVVTTLFCSHKFCKPCWRVYLEKNFYSLANNKTVISCPDKDCNAAVGSEMIEKLSLEDKEKFDKYVLRSYVEENKALMIKPCPGPDCEYFIEFHEDENDEEYSLNVVCVCGFTFCWRCKLESHKPVTCNNASDWLNTVLNSDVSLSLAWTKIITKPCPTCLLPIRMSGGKFFKFMTCTCKIPFCWRCMRSEESHKDESGVYRPCLGPPETPTGEAEEESSSVHRWKKCQASLEEAKRELQSFDKHITILPDFLKEEDIRILREGMMLILQCKQVLKWTCAYDYIHTEYEVSKKEYLRFLQDKATADLEIYAKNLLGELGALYADTYDDLGNFRDRLSTAASNIGNYFYHFTKNLQDGLVDVKVNSYNGLAGQYWYCDRCTYGNTWLEKECQMCCDSTLKELSGLSLN